MSDGMDGDRGEEWGVVECEERFQFYYIDYLHSSLN
jgi:hypothetical protein